MNFIQRRERLLATLDRPVVLFAGGLRGRNYAANPYPFRADSNFSYFFERPEPSSAALFDPEDKSVTLFLPARSIDDVIWHGAIESFDEARARHEVSSREVDHRRARPVHLRPDRDDLAVADEHVGLPRRASTHVDDMPIREHGAGHRLARRRLAAAAAR